MKVFQILLTIMLFSTAAFSQDVISSYEQREGLKKTSPYHGYEARNIGPVVQGGRIVDLAVNESNTKEYYVAYASGGVFKTTNSGITFEPIFEEQASIGIGDIALAPTNSQVIYIGTGENNSSRSSYAGAGVYKSNDAGKTWSFKGLEKTQHIGRVVVHPNNENVIWVAAMGALYTHNEDRGIYKSTDGGESWTKTLFVNDSTGIIDLVIDPKNPDILYAAAWERTRKAWNFRGNGPGSGIYKSTDGGNSWARMMAGFPEGPQLGRIGVAVSASSPNVVYAFLDNQAETKTKKEETEGLKPSAFRDMTMSQLLEMGDESLSKFLKDNGYPEKYTAASVKEDVRQGKYLPKAIAEFFGDANAALFNTSVVGAELYRSDDYAVTWKKMNKYDLEGVNFTYGYYFGEVRVSPEDADKVYLVAYPILKSTDGGSTYARLDTIGDVHVDHHAMWINPKDPAHILLGNDGGLYESYDEGANWRHINNVSVGQFYTVNVDMQEPYQVYGGLQDNGTLVGSSKSVPNRTKHWERIFGGDGMFVNPDPRNHNLVYAGFQFGNYFRIDREKNEFNRITPQHDLGEPVLRFNWRTPLKMSSYNPDILYIGAQKVYRSFDKGAKWQAISGDLTKDLPQGNVPYSTITAITESPINFGELYVGTDDGNVHITKGSDWKLINRGLPNKWVSSLFASPHNKGEVFLAMNGYREDDFKTYIFTSKNHGDTWQSLKGNLPEVVANDLIQDPVNEQVLYLGTDHGLYISHDGGVTWAIFTAIPNVPAYDLIVHPRENELVVATHGRSIYIVDIKPLQAISAQTMIMAFTNEAIRHSEKWGTSRYPYLKKDMPQLPVTYYAGKPGILQVEIKNSDDGVIRTLSKAVPMGYGKINWDMMGKENPKKKKSGLVYVPKGKYQLILTLNGQTNIKTIEVK